MLKKIFSTVVFCFLIVSCASHKYEFKNFKYPEPVDTQNKPIKTICRKRYDLQGIYIDSRFDGARVNDARRINDTLVEIDIEPENYPINNSPWYAFKITSDSLQKIWIKLFYKSGHHRYFPKTSSDGQHWNPIDSSEVIMDTTGQTFMFSIKVKPSILWVAAQPVVNTEYVHRWILQIQKHSLVYDAKSIGKTVLKRDIPFFKIGINNGQKKKIILLFSRQHPPEVTGFFALQSFINELLHNDSLSERFYKDYEFWVFPLINPDGVDLGHWRHNANGVDLNRDWAVFNQPETLSVRNFSVSEANRTLQNVILGIDFHSTFQDIYYVNDQSDYTLSRNLIRFWTNSIDRSVAPFKTIYDASPIKKPVSKAWFYYQFGAAGVTYEVGDNVPVNLIDRKARAAAISLMDLLLQK